MIDIFIVRHGHSPFQIASDYQRTLSLEGKLAATKTAQKISQILNGKTCHIIYSKAQRTAETATIIKQHVNCQSHIAHDHLYSASVGDWQKIILENPSQPLILVGHNPTMSLLVEQLVEVPTHFSPACLAHIKLEIMPDGLKLPAILADFYNPNN
ncbi:MAG: histidine phosphatase family protein [Proteobacteria bacterium]|nr:histidine phosphatase family protein [Pseudomonadota bacterium]